MFQIPSGEKSGKEPLRFWLYDMSKTFNVWIWKISFGKKPFKPQLLICRVVKLEKFVKESGTMLDKLLWLNFRTESDWSLASEESIGLERLHDDMLWTRSPPNGNKEWPHSSPLADIATPSRYNFVISVRFFINIPIFGFSSLRTWCEVNEEDKSRVTNLLRWKFSLGICPSKPALEKFKYLKFWSWCSS